MRHAFVLESIEARTLLSGTPTFKDVHGSVHSDGGTLQDDSSVGVDLDSSIKITIDPSTLPDGSSVDASHLYRSAVRITDTDTGQVLKSTDSSNGANDADLSKVITSGGGDVIIISLKNLLSKNDHYKVELNGSYTNSSNFIRTSNANGTTNFANATFTFSTGDYYAKPTPGFNAAFTDTKQSASGNHGYTATTMGPDGKLYAADSQGYIYAFSIGSDGTLGTPTVITTIRDHFLSTGASTDGNRLITGIAFKNGSTATNMEMWVSSGQYRFGNTPNGSVDAEKYADNFTGEIDALSGSDLSAIEPLIVHIPRSVKDHTNNQIVFSPGVGRSAFFGIAAMNAMGAADSTWGNRVENIYSATIMSIKVGGDNGIYKYILHHGGPVDLMIDGNQNTADGLTAGTLHYNVYKGSNPVRIYADGIRNDYDMVYAANGHLYAGINGSSAGGNVPATPSDLSTVPIANRPDKDAKDSKGNYIYHTDPKDGSSPLKAYTGPTSSALTNVPQVQEDTLLDVKNGAYYGHPDAARGEYILDGGNPTSGTDPYEFAATTSGQSGRLYATGQEPDRSYTEPAYDFGQDYSPDGMIQYKSVNGQASDLDGYLVVARYSSGGDLLALQPKKDGSVGLIQTRIPGFYNLGTPLDLTEDTNTGNIYVAVLTDETGGGYIELLKPTTASSKKKSVTAANLVASSTPAKAAAAVSAFSSKSLVDDLDLDA